MSDCLRCDFGCLKLLRMLCLSVIELAQFHTLISCSLTLHRLISSTRCYVIYMYMYILYSVHCTMTYSAVIVHSYNASIYADNIVISPEIWYIAKSGIPDNRVIFLTKWEFGHPESTVFHFLRNIVSQLRLTSSGCHVLLRMAKHATKRTRWAMRSSALRIEYARLQKSTSTTN